VPGAGARRGAPAATRARDVAVLVTVVAAAVLGPAAAPAQTPDCTYAPCPTAVTGDARAVSATAATLTGIAAPAGREVAAAFLYGRTAGSGTSTPATPVGASAGATALSRRVTGLAPATTYHFRLVVVDDRGLTVTGADRTFTTAAAARPSDKLRPRALSAAVRPRRDPRRPFRFTVAGALTRPKALRRDRVACAGRVRVRLVQGRTVRGRRTTSLGAGCRFRTTVTARRLSGRRGRLVVTTRFLGNGRLQPRSAPARTVRFGPATARP
jgi:hypothetical protein